MDGRLTRAIALTARTSVSVPDWRAAIVAACHPLIEIGVFEDRYERACIESVETHGPYIVLAPGIALAHARPEDGVRELGLGVAVLDEAVAFGHPENDPVDVVLAFGSPNADAHVGLLSALARHLSAGLGDRLRAASADADARAELERVIDDVPQEG